jgi:hypothetical protein
MATVHGRESRWLQHQVAARLRMLDVVLVTLLLGSVGAALANPVAGIVVLAGGLPVYWRVLRHWSYAAEGAKGEFETAILLARLPPDFTVFNDIPLNGFNVDHVVVGPSGIWAVETKSHTGIVESSALGVCRNGRPMYRDPCRQARGNAAEISRLIQSATKTRYWVEALVCFPRATVRAHTGAEEPTVVGSDNLLTRLRCRPVRLSTHQCACIVAALRAIQRGAPALRT